MIDCWSWMKFVYHAMIDYWSWGWYVYHAMIGYWSWGWYVDRIYDRGVDHVWCITKLCHYESYRDHYTSMTSSILNSSSTLVTYCQPPPPPPHPWPTPRWPSRPAWPTPCQPPPPKLKINFWGWQMSGWQMNEKRGWQMTQKGGGRWHKKGGGKCTDGRYTTTLLTWCFATLLSNHFIYFIYLLIKFVWHHTSLNFVHTIKYMISVTVTADSQLITTVMTEL